MTEKEESPKMNLIDAKDVPEPWPDRSSYWKMFEAIPKGKALVITEHTSSVRSALMSAQSSGKFVKLVVRQRSGVLYVINPDDSKTEAEKQEPKVEK